MTAFDIKDNNLDPDTTDNTEKRVRAEKTSDTPEKQWLNKWSDKDHLKENPAYWKIVNRAKETGKGIEDLKVYYSINKEVMNELKTDLQ
jgi:hypothetical protein